MPTITGTVNPELYTPWRPGLRIAFIIAGVLLGTGVWAHAAQHPGASWYVAGGDSYAELYEVLGVMAIGVSAMGGFVLLLVPWLARRSVENRVEITIRKNELDAIGHGRNSGILQRRLASNDTLFSSDTNLIESSLNLKSEVESLLYSLECRFKPFVLIRVMEVATPAELTVIQQVFHSIANVFDYRLADTPG